MIDVQEYKKNLDLRTCNTKEFAKMIQTSEAKARRITHIEGFPCIKIGRDIRIILSKLDEWLEDHIGECL